MNREVLDRLTRKMRRDNRDNRDYRDNRDNRDRRDYADNRDYEDGRRGVRGSGRGRRDYNDYEDSRDYNDYGDYGDYYGRDYDERDYGKSVRLSKADMHHWKKNMENVDGTKGEHYNIDEVMQIAEKMGIRFNHFDEKEFCLAVNMMYSDYCKVVRKHIPPEKELMFYAELAKAFLDDPDGPEPSEKLALYFHCIANA